MEVVSLAEYLPEYLCHEVRDTWLSNLSTPEDVYVLFL